jgi:hypothetical protein
MASKFQPRSEGVNVTSDLPPTLHILLKKTYPKNNIVVGDDRAQIRFLEQRLTTEANKVEAVRVERVTDDMLAGYEGKLYHVSMKHKVDLSPELRSRTGVWAADPIVKGSAAINTLVKFAATLLPGREKTLKREIIDRIGDDITKKPIVDVRAAICKAVWMLSGDLEPNDKWPDPWDSPTAWITRDMNPGKRLNSLYKKLVRYSCVTLYGEAAASKMESDQHKIASDTASHLCMEQLPARLLPIQGRVFLRLPRSAVTQRGVSGRTRRCRRVDERRVWARQES